MDGSLQALATVDDFELIVAWRAGDERAREQLFARHYARVHRFFDVKVPSVADDLTQQTFLACLELADRLERPGSFRAYLFGIARNHLLRYLRRAGRDDARLLPYQTAAGDRTTPSGVVARSEQHWTILRAMEKLPTDLRIALELHYWEGMSTPDIAAVLRVPSSTITTRLSRARARLRSAVVALAPNVDVRQDDLEHWTKSLADRSID